MGFPEKLKEFFASKGLKKKRDIAKAIHTHEQVFGRWMKSDDLSVTFIERLTETFPDIDLNYLLKNNKTEGDASSINEPSEKYLKLTEEGKLIDEIEVKLDKLREILAQNCHKK